MEHKDITKIKEQAKEIQQNLAEQIAKATGVRVVVVNEEKINPIIDALIKEPEINKIYTKTELRKEISDFYIGMDISPPKTEEELTKRINDFIKSLITIKKYTAYIILRGVFNFPIGLKFKNIKFIKPDLRKKRLIEHIEFLNQHKKIHLPEPESWNWIKITFQNHKTIDIREILHSDLELPYAIISLFSQRDLDITDNLGIIYSSHKKSYYLEPVKPQNGWSKFREKDFLKTVKRLSYITNKEKETKLEKKILNSLKVFGLSRLSHRIENRFLMIISACESLLLSNNDRDYLGLKLSEKTTFILLKKGEERKKLFDNMKKFYGLRSKLVHMGESKISSQDLRYLEDIYLNLIIKLVELSKKYEKMEKKSNENDKLGIEDYVESLKFRIKLSS